MAFQAVRGRGYVPGDPRWRVGVAVALAAVVAVYLWTSYRSEPAYLNQYDDAYITFRYAANWARGKGLVFNVGERTDAASSFLYTLLLALNYKVGLTDLERVSFWIGVGSAGGLCGVIAWFAKGRTRSWLAPAALGLSAGLHGFTAGWAVSGMETTLYALLATAVAVRILSDKPGGALTGGLLAAAVLTRFEASILVAGWGILAATHFRRADPDERKELLVAFSIVVVAGLGLLGFRQAYYGTVIPQPFALKHLLLGYQPVPKPMVLTWQTHAPTYVLLGVAGLFHLWRSREASAPAMTAIVVLSAASVLNGPSSDWGRYSTYVLPLLVLSFVDLASECWTRLPSAGAVLFLLLGIDASESFTWMKAADNSIAPHQSCRKEVGRYLASHITTDRPVISSDIGAIAYMAPDVRFLNVVGLTSASVLRALQAGTNLDAIVLDRRPAYVADTLIRTGSTYRYHAVDYIEAQGITTRPTPRSAVGRHMTWGVPLTSCGAAGAQFRFGISTVSYDASIPPVQAHP